MFRNYTYKYKQALFIIIILGLSFSILSGQNESGNVPDPKIESLFKKAKSFQRKGEDKKAIKRYNKILKKEPGHIGSYLQLAGIYYRKGNNTEAINFLNEAIALDSFYDSEMYFSRALINEKLGNKESAVSNYNLYLRFEKSNTKKKDKAKKRIEQLKFIIKSMANPQIFEPVDPGPGINSTALEYLASVNVSNDYMIFSRRIRNQEDLYFSKKINGIWTKAQAIDELNTSGNEAAHCLSPEGKTLIFTCCDRKDSEGSCDLYISHLEENTWSRAENMGSVINSQHWDSQPSLSRDGNTLYFSSTRPGGMGGRDIWGSTRNQQGKWSVPFNLGKNINSKLNDESPFIHPNDLNLYFMSNGHIGMGGYDLFVSQNIQGEWSKPINLGYPINTIEDEGALRVTADGINAYFSSDRKDISQKQNKDIDIYQFQLPKNVQAIPVGYVKGNVIDKETNERIIDAAIILRDNNSKEEIINLTSDYQGEFLATLAQGFDYNLVIQKEGYIYYSDHFDLNIDDNGTKEFNISAFLERIPVVKENEKSRAKQSFVMKNLFFESGSYLIDIHRSEIELNQLLELLHQNPKLRVSIEGHTDHIGSEEDNMELSMKRAEAVYLYLIEKGIEKQRLSYQGFGEKKPIANNDSDEGRSLNRRTAFVIINE